MKNRIFIPSVLCCAFLIAAGLLHGEFPRRSISAKPLPGIPSYPRSIMVYEENNAPSDDVWGAREYLTKDSMDKIRGFFDRL